MKKNTFYKSDSTSKGEVKHLRFIISDPDPEGDVLVVNMTTYHGFLSEDRSCILKKGDHPEVTRESYVVYKFAESLNLNGLYNARFKGLVVFKDQIDDILLARIQQGAKISPFLEEDLEKYFQYF